MKLPPSTEWDAAIRIRWRMVPEGCGDPCGPLNIHCEDGRAIINVYDEEDVDNHVSVSLEDLVYETYASGDSPGFAKQCLSLADDFERLAKVLRDNPQPKA